MMENLRAASNNVVLKILLALIILSFVLTGVGNYLMGGQSNYAVKVNDQEISRQQLESEVKNQQNLAQQRYGEAFSQLAGNELFVQQIQREALSRLIDEALIRQYAKKNNLVTGDDQIKQAIFDTPYFQTEGQFDNARFLSVLRSVGYTSEQYAEYLRQNLTATQLQKALLGTSFILPGEADALAELEFQQRVIRQATINLKPLAEKQAVSDEELKEFYAKNKRRFMLPAQYRVSYVMLDAASLEQKPDETEVRQSYEKNQAAYTSQPQMRYRIIQTKKESEAQSVLDKLKAGDDFAALAKAFSVDPILSKNGGDLGWKESAMLPEEIGQANLSKKGDLSGIIKSSDSFLVAKLEDVRPAQVKPLAEVHDEIVQKLTQKKTLDAYFARQNKMGDAAINNSESLSAVEQAAGVKSVTTEWFNQNTLPKELEFEPLKKAIFDGNLLGQNGAPGSNSDLIQVEGDRAFVLRISDYKPEAAKPLEEVKSQITDELKNRKANKQAHSQAEKIVTELKAGKEDALSAAGLQFSEAKTVKRQDRDALAQAVFTLPKPEQDKHSYTVSEDNQGNVVILALDKVEPGKVTDQQKSQVMAGALNNDAGAVYEALMYNLRKEAKIKYSPDIQSQ